jgi:hypothetical protein
MWEIIPIGPLCCQLEQVCHEGDLVQDAGLIAGEMALLDGSIGLDSFQRVLGRSETSKASLGSEKLLERCRKSSLIIEPETLR